MFQIKKVLFCLFLILAVGLFTIPKLSLAQSVTSRFETICDNNTTSCLLDENAAQVKVTFSNLVPGKNYAFCLSNNDAACLNGETNLAIGTVNGTDKFTATDNSFAITVCGAGNALKTNCGDSDYFQSKNYAVVLYDRLSNTTFHELTHASFTVQRYTRQTISLSQPADKSQPFKLSISGNRRPADNGDRNTYTVDISGTVNGTHIETPHIDDFTVPAGKTGETSFTLNTNGDYFLSIRYKSEDPIKKFKINISDKGITIGEIGIVNPGENPCKTNAQGVIECKTALGNISTDPAGFIGKILGIAIGLAGGIALIFMVMGAIKILTSAGDPKKVTDGRDMIIAAVSGLIFLILSVLILRFIGTNLLGGVPGL